MYRKSASSLLSFAAGAALLAAATLASAQNNISCESSSACKKGHVPVFTSNGGAAQVKDSVIKESNGAVKVGGTVTATKSSTSNINAVFGSNTSAPGNTQGAGVFGQFSSSGESGTGTNWANGGAGAWGDGGADGNYGTLGTADFKSAGIFDNNSSGYYSLFGYNFATGSTGFPWAAFNGDGAGCNIDTTGDLSCSGSKNAVVAVEGGKHYVALAAVESPKNWFEDFGSAELVGGVATVRLDPRFIQTVNTEMEYHVFLTPNGECKGLYVNQKTRDSFEVRELGNGNSSVRFDYRISALRKNYEKVRFAEHREFSHKPSRDGRVFDQNQ